MGISRVKVVIQLADIVFQLTGQGVAFVFMRKWFFGMDCLRGRRERDF
jgi:hypothetical protein